jgi:lysyl-tRNA synthetase class 2
MMLMYSYIKGLEMETAEKNEQHKTEGDIRRGKLELIKQKGMLPYAERYEINHKPGDVAGLSDGDENIKIAGRIVFVRHFGKLSFVKLFDQSGTAQLALKFDELGDAYKLFTDIVDIGDYIGASGTIFTTKTGEKTIRVKEWSFLSKSLRTLPEKFHGLSDTETKLRKRYLDLISSPETMTRFKTRTKIVRTIRSFLDDNGFTEIETPVLLNKASGALATPFATHHNALDLDVYLRIAPETYLKRAIAGGFDRVYEFARCFRNEGMDPSHLQDFTMLEFYASYWNYEDNMDFTEKLIKHLLVTVLGKMEVTYGGTAINFDGEWPRYSFRDLIFKDCGIDIDVDSTKDKLLAAISAKKIAIEAPLPLNHYGFGTLVDLLYKKVSRPGIIAPVFVTKHPVDLSPLARRSDKEPGRVDRFQLVVNGWEVVNAYSELIDPIDQAGRFEEQMKARAGGDTEAMEIDEDFLQCMEYGMPPMSGWGMGIDRICALLTDSETLRDVVLFPLMKPEV